MSDQALGLLVFVVCGLGGGVLLGYSVSRILGRAHGKRGATLEAFDTGAVSLFASDPRTNLTPAMTSPRLILGEKPVSRSRAAIVLDAFASGGVSIFTEPAKPPRARTDDHGREF